MPHMTQESVEMMIRGIADPLAERIAATDMYSLNGNAYENASEWYQRAMDAYPVLMAIAERLKVLANEMVDQATDQLRQYEEKPGIPKAEYR